MGEFIASSKHLTSSRGAHEYLARYAIQEDLDAACAHNQERFKTREHGARTMRE